MIEKQGIVKYAKIMKRLFVVMSIVVLPLFMLCLVYAFMGFAAFWIITPVLGVGYLTAYGFYAMRLSMGTVTGIEVTDKVVHVKTPRKTFTYDVRMGCIAVRVKKNKFICTFRTEDSKDTFLFYRRVLFSPYYQEQFTKEEVAQFYPKLEGIA